MSISFQIREYLYIMKEQVGIAHRLSLHVATFFLFLSVQSSWCVAPHQTQTLDGGLLLNHGP